MQDSIPSIITRLIEHKSTKDMRPFTASQLADAINVHRSVITKLIQPDSSKRVTNPRIDTLVKIVKFFKKDGIDITLDELVGICDK